jgi:hypothetical protein
MINGVLVERTVKDVVPALQTNSEGLKKVLEELMKSYRSKNVEMESWKVSGASDRQKERPANLYYRRRTIFKLFHSKVQC